MQTQHIINDVVNQAKTNSEVMLETILDHKKFLAEPIAVFEFPEMSRDMTLGNINQTQLNIILIHETQLSICNDLNLEGCKNLFNRKIAAILNLSRSLDGFAHKNQITSITKLEEINSNQQKSIKDLWRAKQ